MLVPDPEVPGGERAKILDFGIAKLASTVPGKPGEAGAADSGGSAGSVKTRTGAMLGTPTYMAPEQCRGVGPIDDRVDVYSLGVMIYELMAGDPPFVSDGFGELVAMHMFEPAPPLGKKVPKVNPELAGLVGRMLAKKAPERPSMAEVVRVLERIIAQSPGAKHPSLVGGVDPVPESLREGKGGAAVGAELTGQPYPSTLGRSAGQRVGLGEGTGTRRSAVLAGAAGLLVVAAGVGIWFRPRPTPALPPAPIVQVTPTPALPAPPVPSVETPVGRGAAPAAPGMNPGAPSPGANPSVPSPGVAPSAPAPGAPAAIPGDAGDAGRRQIEQLVRTGKQKQRAGDLSGAQVAFARAIKLERKNPAPYYLLLAQAQAAGKQYADALDTVNKLLSVEPGSQSGQLLKREISGMLAESRRR